jgi:hypothetical protein
MTGGGDCIHIMVLNHGAEAEFPFARRPVVIQIIAVGAVYGLAAGRAFPIRE